MNLPEYRRGVRQAIERHQQQTATAHEEYRSATALSDDQLTTELQRLDDALFEEQDKPVAEMRGAYVRERS